MHGHNSNAHCTTPNARAQCTCASSAQVGEAVAAGSADEAEAAEAAAAEGDPEGAPLLPPAVFVGVLEPEQPEAKAEASDTTQEEDVESEAPEGPGAGPGMADAEPPLPPPPPPEPPPPAFDSNYFSKDPASTRVGWRDLEQMWELDDESRPVRQLGTMRGVNFGSLKVECFLHRGQGQGHGKCGVMVYARGAWDTLNAEVIQFFRAAAAYKGADHAAEAAHHATLGREMRARIYAAYVAAKGGASASKIAAPMPAVCCDVSADGGKLILHCQCSIYYVLDHCAGCSATEASFLYSLSLSPCPAAGHDALPKPDVIERLIDSGSLLLLFSCCGNCTLAPRCRVIVTLLPWPVCQAQALLCNDWQHKLASAAPLGSGRAAAGRGRQWPLLCSRMQCLMPFSRS